MKWLPALVLVVIPFLGPALGHADKVFKKAENETWDCANDPVVRISQDKGTFGFIGDCKRITVSGGNNVLSIVSVGKLVVGGKTNMVEAEKVDSISVSGSSNQVRWKEALNGDKPKITKGGRGNRVEQKK
jgi:hypothetical protein